MLLVNEANIMNKCNYSEPPLKTRFYMSKAEKINFFIFALLSYFDAGKVVCPDDVKVAVQYWENLQACGTIADEFQYDYKWFDILHNINDYRPVTLDELIINNRKFKDMKKDLDWRRNMLQSI